MGIRIKKMMGYSLSLKEVKSICPVDMTWRHDWEYFMENENKWNEMFDLILEINNEYSSNTENPYYMEAHYIKKIRKNRDKKYPAKEYILSRLTHGDFCDFVRYDDEFGDPDTILFRPLLAPKDWHRYDDSIDYIEASLDSTLMEPKVVRHNHTLYPFIQLMRKNPDSYFGIETYWESCYLNNSEHKDAVPFCTYSVMLMLKFMNLVPEDKLEDVIMTMRPTIYSYWS